MLCAMPRTVRPEGLTELLDRQLAVISRAQLLGLGMTEKAVRHRLRPGGPWQVLLPGIYLGTNAAPTLIQKEMAALLHAGPGSVITGPIALFHHGIRAAANLDIVDVLIPAGRQRRSTAFTRVHRTAHMPRRTASSGPVRLALVPRAVADTVRQLTSLRDVRAVTAEAVQLGRCTISELASELIMGPNQGSALFRSVLGEVAEGIRSTAEGDLRDLIVAAQLPMPLFNPSLYDGDTFIAKPDAWWPDAGVVAEADSRQWHLSPEDWDRTRERHDRMAAIGIIPLHFSPRQIRQESGTVVEMIRGALRRGLQRPPLPIRTIPCATGIPTVQDRRRTGPIARA
jgi:hypothetical protein